MDLLRIAAIALCGVFLAAVSRETRSGLRLYIVVGVSVILLAQVLSGVVQVQGFLQTLSGALSSGGDLFGILLKAVAAAYVTDFTAQLCRDAGEHSIAEKTELAGKVVIFLMALPIMEQVLETIELLLPS